MFFLVLTLQSALPPRSSQPPTIKDLTRTYRTQNIYHQAEPLFTGKFPLFTFAIPDEKVRNELEAVNARGRMRKGCFFQNHIDCTVYPNCSCAARSFRRATEFWIFQETSLRIVCFLFAAAMTQFFLLLLFLFLFFTAGIWSEAAL